MNQRNSQLRSSIVCLSAIKQSPTFEGPSEEFQTEEGMKDNIRFELRQSLTKSSLHEINETRSSLVWKNLEQSSSKQVILKAQAFSAASSNRQLFFEMLFKLLLNFLEPRELLVLLQVSHFFREIHFKRMIDSRIQRLLNLGTNRMHRNMFQYAMKIERKRPQIICEFEVFNRTKSQFEETITNDVARTFPMLDFFKSSTTQNYLQRTWKPYSFSCKSQDNMKSILRAFSQKNQQIGYAQGINYFAAILLSFLPPEEAYWTLSQLFEKYELNYLYGDNFKNLEEFTFLISCFFKNYLADLFNHMKIYGVQCEIIFQRWVLSFFASNFELSLLSKLLGLFVLKGFKTIVRTALALLYLHRNNLLKCQSLEDLYEYLQDGILEEKITSHGDFLRDTKRFKVTRKLISECLTKYRQSRNGQTTIFDLIKTQQGTLQWFNVYTTNLPSDSKQAVTRQKRSIQSLYISNTKLNTELFPNDKEKQSPQSKNGRRDWSISHDEKSFSTLATKNSGIIASPFTTDKVSLGKNLNSNYQDKTPQKFKENINQQQTQVSKSQSFQQDMFKNIPTQYITSTLSSTNRTTKGNTWGGMQRSIINHKILEEDEEAEGVLQEKGSINKQSELARFFSTSNNLYKSDENSPKINFNSASSLNLQEAKIRILRRQESDSLGMRQESTPSSIKQLSSTSLNFTRETEKLEQRSQLLNQKQVDNIKQIYNSNFKVIPSNYHSLTQIQASSYKSLNSSETNSVSQILPSPISTNSHAKQTSISLLEGTKEHNSTSLADFPAKYFTNDPSFYSPIIKQPLQTNYSSKTDTLHDNQPNIVQPSTLIFPVANHHQQSSQQKLQYNLPHCGGFFDKEKPHNAYSQHIPTSTEKQNYSSTEAKPMKGDTLEFSSFTKGALYTHYRTSCMPSIQQYSKQAMSLKQDQLQNTYFKNTENNMNIVQEAQNKAINEDKSNKIIGNPLSEMNCSNIINYSTIQNNNSFNRQQTQCRNDQNILSTQESLKSTELLKPLQVQEKQQILSSIQKHSSLSLQNLPNSQNQQQQLFPLTSEIPNQFQLNQNYSNTQKSNYQQFFSRQNEQSRSQLAPQNSQQQGGFFSTQSQHTIPQRQQPQQPTLLQKSQSSVSALELTPNQNKQLTSQTNILTSSCQRQINPLNTNKTSKSVSQQNTQFFQKQISFNQPHLQALVQSQQNQMDQLKQQQKPQQPLDYQQQQQQHKYHFKTLVGFPQNVQTAVLPNSTRIIPSYNQIVSDKQEKLGDQTLNRSVNYLTNQQTNFNASQSQPYSSSQNPPNHLQKLQERKKHGKPQSFSLTQGEIGSLMQAANIQPALKDF